ncbi:uncharacterized protein LOC133173727 [Saccostrea echinata]|uniref:uncharacterized protein LOC133173727 n=1 Tax=Saccostrea echinata TaxID=191078 RepID=UPI002A83A3F7|nr:uncharacterized protein LOC133173727 [Saccostrea echinata]XP_061164732.1 uncharacterized protein LOC133173727 [Saccostrea echinata]XP_061164733.1 uncharacterized protein LOC133173727 [Saccostrea echinata]
MWNSGMSNWGAGSTEGNTLGKKRSYAETGFSTDNNGGGFGPPSSSYMKSDYGQDDYGYGGQWPDYDASYGSSHETHHHQSPPEDMMSSMGLPTSFTATIDQPSENFAEDIPLEGKGRKNHGGVYQTPVHQNQGQYGRGGRGGGQGGRGGRGQNKRGQGRGGGGHQRGGRGGGGGQRGGGGGGYQNKGRGGGRGGGNNYDQPQWGAGFHEGGGGRGRGGNNFRGNVQKKPGLPPNKVFSGNNKRGRGRGTRGGSGGQFGGTMAPVHSLSKVATQQFDTANMSTAEKIHRFALYVQGEPMKVNAIQTIENAITGSKLNLKTQYEVEELMRISGKWMFTGRLILGGIFLARSVGANKKEVKHETYQKALDVLKTKTVAEIFNLTDPGAEAIRKELASTLDTEKDVSKQADTILQKQTEQAMTIRTNQDGFICLIEYIKSAVNLPENKISCMEQAMSASHCALSHKYDFKASRLPTGRFFFHGILTVGDIVIAVGKGHRKKDAKVHTYEEAFKNLMTKPLQEVLKGIDVEEEAKTEEEASGTGVTMIVDGKKMSVTEKMDKMIQRLKDAVYKENNINTVDACATNLGLTKTCIYRRLQGDDEGDPSRVACDLYLEKFLIASGEGEKRKEAQIDAYNNAWEVLITTTGEHIIKDHKRLTNDNDDPSIIDVHVKGAQKPQGDSNLAGLKRHNQDHEDPTKTVDTLVILEHEEWTMDRKRQAFCILTYSATSNGMLLQWNTSQEGNMFKCDISLQGTLIGEAKAMSKNNARNLAAADALFKLYESQDVIKVTRRDDSKLWIAYSNILGKAKILKERQGDGADPDLKPSFDNEGNVIPIPEDANKWVLKVCEEIINEYKDQFTMEELIFGPGMPLHESKEVRNMAKSGNLRHDIRQLEGQSYLVIQHRMQPQDIAKCVHSANGRSGKYILVDKSSLPSHQDIVPDLEKQIALSGSLAGQTKSEVKAPNPLQGFKPRILSDQTSEEGYDQSMNRLY